MKLAISPDWIDESNGQIGTWLSLDRCDGNAVSLELPVVLTEINSFGRRLSSFPAAVGSEVVLVMGSEDPDALSYARLRAFTFNDRGHAAIEIETRYNPSEQMTASTRLVMPVEAAALNRMGRALTVWDGARAFQFWDLEKE